MKFLDRKIKSAMETLQKEIYEVSAQIYKAQTPPPGAENAGQQAAPDDQSQGQSQPQDNVVDAEVKEVKKG